MIPAILFAVYLLVALVISLLMITVKHDEDSPVGFYVAAGMLWLPIIVAVVLMAGVAAMLRGRAV